MSVTIPFLNVYVLWHAEAKCRPMAGALFKLLSWNTERPFAREIGIPTFFRTRPDGWWNAGPAGIDLDAAAHSVIFALVESKFVLDDNWVTALTRLQAQVNASGNRHRLVVVAVDQNGLQLPEAITARLAVRLFDYPAGVQVQELCLHAAAQISRVIEGGVPGAPAGVKLFISHTKRDPRSLSLAKEIRELLTRDGPAIKYFFDTVNIDVAEEIEKVIETDIDRSTLLVVRSDGYAASPWCQLEVLAAKRKQRPIVILDALEEREDRTLPCMGNVPCLRIDIRPSTKMAEKQARLLDAVEATVVETMRFLYVRGRLEYLRSLGRLPTDAVVSPRPPEDRDLRRLEALTAHTVVYPDPPLAQCELEDLQHPQTTLITPLTYGARELSRRTVGLSLSTPPEGLDEVGLSEAHLSAATDLIARALLSKGVTLAYGGDLRSGGITDFLVGLVRAHNATQRDPYKRIRNYLPWPKHLTVSEDELAGQAKHLQVIPVPPPQDLVDAGLVDPHTAPGRDSAGGAYAWARGMLAMRERMTADTDARVVLGGKLRSFTGRYPGIVEEVLLSLQARKPVFILGGFGGAAQAVAELLRGETPARLDTKAMRADQDYDAMVRFYDRDIVDRKLPLPPIDCEAVFREIRNVAGADLNGLNNGLSTEENLALLRMQDIDEAVWLILQGMTRLWSMGRA
ncbi:TIR domain-containing protein [Azospirillum sp. sgz302134]